jgi:glutamate transport system permease protein
MSVLERMLQLPEPAPGEIRITEDLGPRGRQRVLVASAVSVGLLAALLWWVFKSLNKWRYAPNSQPGDAPLSKGQFEWKLWEPFTQKLLWKNAIYPGVSNTMRAFVVGFVLALLIGVFMGMWRSGDSKPVRIASSVYVETFRACALVLLIRFAFFQLGRSFPEWRSIWKYSFVAVVLGLTLYYSTVFAEIIRSSLRSLSAGQKEAGLAIGMTSGQVMRSVLFPQAFRRALPNIVGQAASLLKDTSIGYLVTYPELATTSDLVKQNYENSLQTYFVFWMIYAFLVACVSSIANRLQRQQSTKR